MKVRLAVSGLFPALVAICLAAPALAGWEHLVDSAAGTGRISYQSPQFTFVYSCSRAQNQQTYALHLPKDFAANKLDKVEALQVGVSGETYTVTGSGDAIPFRGQVSQWRLEHQPTGPVLTYGDRPRRGVALTLAYLFATSKIPVSFEIGKPGPYDGGYARPVENLDTLTLEAGGDTEKRFVAAFEACGLDMTGSRFMSKRMQNVALVWRNEAIPGLYLDDERAVITDEQKSTMLQVTCNRENGLRTVYTVRKQESGDPLATLTRRAGDLARIYVVATIISEGGRQLLQLPAELKDGGSDWNVQIAGVRLPLAIANSNGAIEIGMSEQDPSQGGGLLVYLTSFPNTRAGDAFVNVFQNCDEYQNPGGSRPAPVSAAPASAPPAGKPAPAISSLRWTVGAANGGSADRIAQVGAGNKVLHVGCIKGKLRTYYKFPKNELAPGLDPSGPMTAVLWFDRVGNKGKWQAYWVEKKLVDLGNEWAAVFGGHEFPTLLMKARRGVEIGFTTTDPKRRGRDMAMTAFTATGSTAAMQDVLKACGGGKAN